MIELTKLKGKKFFLNCDLIETIEFTPDTVITLRNGKIYLVAESPEEVAELVLKYKRKQFADLINKL